MATNAAVVVQTIVWLTACAGARPVPAAAVAGPGPEAPTAPPPSRSPSPDPDLHHPPPRRVLDIDWSNVAVTSDAEATALWRRIAPTGADWEDKLQEIPAELAGPLAIAVLRGGGFTCARPATAACAAPVYDVEPPTETAGFDDPCLRRVLALWAIAQLDGDDLPAVHDALRGIAAIPPPESQLVSAAIHLVPEADHDARLALLAIAARAGQHDLVDAAVGALDEPHLVQAVRQYHIAGALEVLSAEASRAVYLAAVGDEALAAHARITAIGDLAAQGPKLAPDLATVLVAATRSRDCGVAATASRVLDQHGDHRFVPRRPRTASLGQVMRALCVLASYEALQASDEASLLATYVPTRGLERTTITYDPLSEVDSDGDGDPHTTHTAELVPRGDAVLPELEDLGRAMQHCTGAICVSDDHEFRFVWRLAGGELLLHRIELADRPPCDPRVVKP